MTEYRNPQHESGTEKNLLLVTAAIVVALVMGQQLWKRSPEATPQKTQAPAAVQQQAAAPASAPAVAPPPKSPVKGIQASGESTTVVENDVYRITFSNRGALVKSWVLKKFKDDHGNPLDLVNQAGAGEWGYPLSLWSWEPELRDKLNSALYVASASGAMNAPGVLTFEYADGDLTVRKSFHFDSGYVVRLESSAARGGSYVTALPAWPSGFGDATMPASYAAQNIDYSNGEKVTRLKADRKGKEISDGNVMRGTFEWVGPSDQYFAALFLPERPQQASVVTLRNQIQVPKNPEKPTDTQKVELLGAAVGNLAGPTSERIFVGPKEVDLLNSIRANTLSGQPNGANLRELIDFGFFWVIARPLFAWLTWTHQYVHNWGWAIIVLTLIINLALLPLRFYQMKSALEMQKIQPQIQQIQAKYKKYPLRDPRRAEMQQEISGLYKEHNVNPASGCLPLLIQMPILWAFYRMLSSTIELRQAKWLWLSDLSSPDRHLILPVLIVVTTLIMQKLTPQAGVSKEQQRMMNLMMPLMLGFFSYSVASGLGLYWVMGTIVGIAQQAVMNRTKLGQEIHAIAEKRARKQALKQ